MLLPVRLPNAILKSGQGDRARLRTHYCEIMVLPHASLHRPVNIMFYGIPVITIKLFAFVNLCNVNNKCVTCYSFILYTSLSVFHTFTVTVTSLADI